MFLKLPKSQFKNGNIFPKEVPRTKNIPFQYGFEVSEKCTLTDLFDFTSEMESSTWYVMPPICGFSQTNESTIFEHASENLWNCQEQDSGLEQSTAFSSDALPIEHLKESTSGFLHDYEAAHDRINRIDSYFKPSETFSKQQTNQNSLNANQSETVLGCELVCQSENGYFTASQYLAQNETSTHENVSDDLPNRRQKTPYSCSCSPYKTVNELETLPLLNSDMKKSQLTRSIAIFNKVCMPEVHDVSPKFAFKNFTQREIDSLSDTGTFFFSCCQNVNVTDELNENGEIDISSILPEKIYQNSSTCVDYHDKQQDTLLFSTLPYTRYFVNWARVSTSLDYKRIKLTQVETQVLPGPLFVNKDLPELREPPAHSSFLATTPITTINFSNPRIRLSYHHDFDQIANFESSVTEDESSSQFCSGPSKLIAVETTEIKNEVLLEMLDPQHWVHDYRPKSSTTPRIRSHRVSNLHIKGDQGFTRVRSIPITHDCTGDTNDVNITNEKSNSSLNPADFWSVSLDLSTDRTIRDLPKTLLSPQNNNHPRSQMLSASIQLPCKSSTDFEPSPIVQNPKSKNKYVTKWLARNEKDFGKLNCLKPKRGPNFSKEKEEKSFNERRKDLRRLSSDPAAESSDSKTAIKTSRTSTILLKKRSPSLAAEKPIDVPLLSLPKKETLSSKTRFEAIQENDGDLVRTCLNGIKGMVQTRSGNALLVKIFDQTLLENVYQFRERTLSSYQVTKVLARFDPTYNNLTVKSKQKLVRCLMPEPSSRIDSKTLLKRLNGDFNTPSSAKHTK